MPLKPGKSQKVISSNISEFHKGTTYQKTARKFGKSKANKQAVAVALSEARRREAEVKRWRKAAKEELAAGAGLNRGT